MAYDIGFVDNTGTEGVAHWQMLLKIKTFAEANGWTTLRYLNPTPYTNSTVIRELILKGTGLSGTEEIYIGFRAYQNQSADYYNLSVAGFTGYVAGNAFTLQPGYFESGIPAHNQHIDYWLAVNAQRVLLGMKVGTPVYEHGYVGKMYPYATPGQYPYPLIVGGMLNGVPGTRFSDSSHSMPYKGSRSNFELFNVSGSWQSPATWPWSNGYLAGGTSVRDTNGSYPILPIVVSDNSNTYGKLDGVYMISGFNNTVENTLTIGGKQYVVLQDVSRTGFADYVALEMS